MGKSAREAAKPASGAVKRRGAKPSGGGSGPTVRRQFHLGEQTAHRLGVHCSLAPAGEVGNESRVVDEILSGWLRRYGRGRVVFGDPVDTEDRPAAPDPVNLDVPK